MNNTEQIFCVVTVGNHQPRMLITLQQLADLVFRRVGSICSISWRDVIMLLTVRWLKIKYPLNHPPFLRIKDLLVTMIHQHGRGFGVQFRIFFCPLSRRITASVVRWRSVWLAERKRRRLKIAN